MLLALCVSLSYNLALISSYINIRMVSSLSVKRVSVHTAKRAQKYPMFRGIRHLHVDLIFCCLANLGYNSGMSIRTLKYDVNVLGTMVS